MLSYTYIKVIEMQKKMTIDQALSEWYTKKRRMGCVAASEWFCKRVPGFWCERLTRYTENGELFQHEIATNGRIRIDLAPYADGPDDSELIVYDTNGRIRIDADGSDDSELIVYN